MLELRPNCEHCKCALAPDSTLARICSFECTFCADCAENLLHNVCPNSGGGFSARPVRPVQDRRNGNFLGRYPAGRRVVYKPVDLAAHEQFCLALKKIPPARR
ncbi:DUF1272 domain-containing protein [Amphritea sp. HPY]|uniref:DUF1272 domain-containing protein n=1 Tax=Amphritea sp. HPY TaxID=3421652 RepID=UPI003D7EA841